MKVEIWSDVVCPFCYIGKRKFETALAQFSDKNNIEVIWKSYQLMPDMVTNPDKKVYQLVSEKHGIPLERSKAMHSQMTQTAKELGLVYNFDKAIPANTLKAHQLIQYAKTKGKQDQAEETLFRSYLTEGKNIDDVPTLLEIGTKIGLDKMELKMVLDKGTYISEVQADIYEAQQVGVRGVPFFVLDRKYAISGAQEPKEILASLQKAFVEWRKENPDSKLEIIHGAACTPDGECH
ncbi:DSBA oxidoreductase [Pedobacter kyungheensis]|uniref:DSBA oxidoreductase n=2 Tax=Pedobacter kyungheensis TaxID=1069985 RepID=A0A0C1FAK3_9SPHI|nr:DSBA oxidoreductase [Pedobacter kyungheensis]